MPFINDRIEANREALARANHLNSSRRSSRFSFDPQAVVDLLHSRIVGQQDVLTAMEDMLFSVKADISNQERPLAVQLFVGPTGCGKTETARVIAEAILGNADQLCRIDMNTLSQEHYAAALTGAPPGYVGSREGQTLLDTEAIQGSFSKPGIVLFDEIEKASREVIRALLNVLDTGLMTLASGSRQIDFRNTLIFMTSNIGAQEVADYRAKFSRGWRAWLGRRPDNEHEVVDEQLHKSFDPEFLNRIDRILFFERLDESWALELLAIELNKLSRRLQRRGINLSLDESARTYLCRPFDIRFGGRELARRIRTELEPVLARALLAYPDIDVFCARFTDGVFAVRPQ